MGMPEGCPCEAVRRIEELVERHERQLNDGTTQFALIQQDMGWIKAKLEEKKNFNTGIIASIIQGICMLVLTYIAAKIGLA